MTKNFDDWSFLFGSNSVFIEELYQKYLQDKSSVDSSWHAFFEAYPGGSAFTVVQGNNGSSNLSGNADLSLQARFMIKAYRERGHYLAKLDPLGMEQQKIPEELKLTIDNFGFTREDLSKNVDVSGEFSDIGILSLQELETLLQKTYAGTIGVEFAHLENMDQQKWLYDKFDSLSTHVVLSPEDKKSLLKELVQVEGFEQYLHVKFPGAKRFSVEGADASIPCLETVIEESAVSGAKEVVLGLTHRGRLSTLTKVMQKPYRAIFSEFMGSSAFPNDLGVAGDVKYHMGYSSDRQTQSGREIHLSLTPNPSHLEAVNPVVAGKVRAKQDVLGRDRTMVVGVLVHGDAAFCGQGVVAESLVMSGLKPYDVGGIFHLVINNQIGFTADSSDSRSGRYCTEVAKMVGAPIFHVNGDDIEAVILVTKLACQYRARFQKDVVVDIVCYRKYGHNEGDEPMYTQSMMYNIIKAKKTPAAIYAERLIANGLIDENYYPTLKQEFKSLLDSEFAEVESYKPRAQWLEGQWSGFDRLSSDRLLTGEKKSVLQDIGKKLCSIPPGFAINPKLARLFEERAKTLAEDKPVDWATAEQLAYGSLLLEGVPIRITGQDAQRGTFSHRHTVLHSQVDKSVYEPLNNLDKNRQALFEIADSNLSEYGVLGFEYGYSLVDPNRLVIWEAQFGDFANGAQIIFDQFISSAETKWLRMSGIVVLLPHGMEGQGPEHSSARLERFLQLCAEDNMCVVYPTTPASIFHLLRRQMKRNFRKPLIVMSPKSLLRHELAVSSLAEMDQNTQFVPVVDEIDENIKPAKVNRVIFCTGKVYYDLLVARREKKIRDIAIVRLEQLYPFPEGDVVEVIRKYKGTKEFIWCQEEPRNMGAWKFIRPNLDEALEKVKVGKQIGYIGRDRSASPAVGYLYVHNKQQAALVERALYL